MKRKKEEEEGEIEEKVNLCTTNIVKLVLAIYSLISIPCMYGINLSHSNISARAFHFLSIFTH